MRRILNFTPIGVLMVIGLAIGIALLTNLPLNHFLHGPVWWKAGLISIVVLTGIFEIIDKTLQLDGYYFAWILTTLAWLAILGGTAFHFHHQGEVRSVSAANIYVSEAESSVHIRTGNLSLRLSPEQVYQRTDYFSGESSPEDGFELRPLGFGTRLVAVSFQSISQAEIVGGSTEQALKLANRDPTTRSSPASLAQLNAHLSGQ